MKKLIGLLFIATITSSEYMGFNYEPSQKYLVYDTEVKNRCAKIKQQLLARKIILWCMGLGGTAITLSSDRTCIAAFFATIVLTPLVAVVSKYLINQDKKFLDDFMINSHLDDEDFLRLAYMVYTKDTQVVDLAKRAGKINLAYKILKTLQIEA